MIFRGVIVLHVLICFVYFTKGEPQTDKIPTFVFHQDETKTARFDFCSVVDCGAKDKINKDTWLWSDKYICVTEPNSMTCGKWGLVGWNTSPNSWGYTPTGATSRVNKGENLLQRMTLIKAIPSDNCRYDRCNPLFLSIRNPTQEDSGTYVLGAVVEGKDPIGQFKIVVIGKDTQANPTPLPIFGVKYLDNLKYEDKLAIETGFSDTNLWVEWVRYTALSQDKSECIACAAARPHLGTVPFPLDDITDPEGLKCILKMYSETVPINEMAPRCKTLALLYPAVKEEDHMGFSVVPYPGNYTCFERNSVGLPLGAFPPGYCSHIVQLTDPSNGSDDYLDRWFINQIKQHADIWWMCGDLKLRPRMQAEWVGQCALVKILMPFQIFSPPKWNEVNHKRSKRSLPTSFDPHVYIDAIGVPRGVPDEFKARNQIAAGFESLIPMIAINKNVDWINYLYYNQQRFVNYTRDAVKGIAEQLGSTSIMVWQNRLALDMILAEKGGVCKMFGASCCTFIPNNTAPDGSITKALKGLTALSEELAENSGIDNAFTSWLEKWFGSWSNVVANLVITLVVVFVILSLICCCVIPCFRKLALHTFNTSMTSNTMYMNSNPIKDKDYYDQLFQKRNSALKQTNNL